MRRVVLLHGVGSSALRRSWCARFSTSTSSTCRVRFRPALPCGFEASSPAHAEVVERELDDRGIEAADLVGNSSRGWLALELARRGRARTVTARVAEGQIAPSQLRRLRELADDAERATDARDTSAAATCNRAFHQGIDALADSPVSAAAVDPLWDRILVATERSLVSARRREAVNREHRALLAALAAGAAADSAEIAGRHVRATLEAA